MNAPSAAGGWTKAYDGGTAFETADITVGGITNKVGTNDVIVSVANATYDTAAVGSGNKTLTVTYAIGGADSGNYSAPADAVINTASITAAMPAIALTPKTAVYTGNIIEIAAATVTGVAAEGDITANYADTISYAYYTNEACADSDKTAVDRSGAATAGGAPKNAGTYYVKAAIAASGNYTAATSAAVTLTIYHPSSGGGSSSSPAAAPVIVDGKTVNIGTETKAGEATTVTVDQSKLSTNISGAASGSSVVVPVSATGADMSRVPFNVTIQNSSASVAGETFVLW